MTQIATSGTSADGALIEITSTFTAASNRLARGREVYAQARADLARLLQAEPQGYAGTIAYINGQIVDLGQPVGQMWAERQARVAAMTADIQAEITKLDAILAAIDAAS